MKIPLVRQGSIALRPILIVFISVAAFLAVMYYALPSPKQKTAVTNTAVTTNTAVVTNTSVNTNTTTDSTKDWKTFASSKYYFSIKYPSNFDLVDPCGTTGTLVTYCVSFSSNNQQDFNVFIHPSHDIIADGWFSASTITSSTTKVFGNISWRIVTTKRDVDGKLGKTAITVYNGVTYSVSTNNQDNPIFETALSTFAFTSPTAGWKTYTSSKYHITLQYPPDWKVTEGATTTPYKITVAPSSGSQAAIIMWVGNANSYRCGEDGSSTTSQTTIGGIPATLYSAVDAKISSCKFRSYSLSVTPVGWSKPTNSAANEIQVVADSAGSFTTDDMIIETLKLSNPTAGWKTYTDTTYGYSFKYPSDWSLQVAHANDPSNVFGTESAYVTDSANSDILFEVCPTSKGCIVTQDAQYQSTESAAVISEHAATKSYWTVAPAANCSSCTPATTIKFTPEPTGWFGDENILIRGGASSSTVPASILSTFTFTK